MSVNTLVKDGTLTDLRLKTKILKVDAKVGEVHYNPGICRAPDGTIFISIRSCITNQKEHQGVRHPLGYENFLHVGILNEKTLEIEGLKLIEPADNYEGFQWGIEDIRLYWREDGMHGVGVILPLEGKQIKLRQGEILIDYEAGTYTLLRDLGRPFGHAEKNWSPSEHANPHFDFIYSPTQIVKDGKVTGEPNELFIHNGTPLVEYDGGYISIGHVVTSILGERTYAQLALKWSAEGKLLAHSQFFHFNVGWREKLKETIEFASGLLWSGDNLLVTLGVKDEVAGISLIDPDSFKWATYQDTIWYAWNWETLPNRTEITNEPTPDLAYRHIAPSRQPA